MIYRTFLKLLSRHVASHLLVPLFVGVAVEVVVDHFFISHDPWLSVLKTIPTRQRLTFWAGVIVTYIVIAGYLLWRDTDVYINPADLVTFRRRLSAASEYFAISTTAFHEWFEPYTQIYLATTISRSKEPDAFWQCRVQLFFRQSQLNDIQSVYLDGLYAKAFARIHEANQIPLGYLEPDELYDALAQLTAPELVQLRCISRVLAVLPHRMRLWVIRRKGRLKSLRFGLLVNGEGKLTVLKFRKYGISLELKFDSDPDRVAPYKHLADLVRSRIVRSDGVIEERQLKTLTDGSALSDLRTPASQSAPKATDPALTDDTTPK